MSNITHDDTNSNSANKLNACVIRSRWVSSTCSSIEVYDIISHVIPVVIIQQQDILIKDHTKSVLSISLKYGPIYTEVGIKSNNHSACISFKKRWFSNMVISCEVK